jgi:hypothetical protein
VSFSQLKYLVVCATIASGVSEPCDAAPTVPEQAWAHKSGKIILKAQDANSASLSAADRLLIHEVFARFGIAYDEVRLDVMRTLFTDDISFEVSDGAKTLVQQRGRDEVLAILTSALSQQADQRRHLIGNVVIDRHTKSTVSALAYGIVTVAADGLSLGGTVFYSTDLRREKDGVWRFSRLLIGMDTYAGKKPTPPAATAAPK